ncbi:tyrosine-type recombinase/integrase [Streptomyces clavuligerus]|uniref:Putative integrase n=1 Tax=Streptomyces clavuligerus TaxID=1901 RepID=B5GQP7_STRCL|nr:tyrosine-type recombinase/integrase [Streptomyces clavuligerus]ANW20378.1 integrase [Streptomyces clavuligerus]AXU15004.1 integrase [Streptomyces clavuligerus]EDY48643.1 conserved hypothetical protein [Streptomyces clavuligerus]EFG06670.1 Putative integrase [Streptomyces clavuligerus]MBY6305056.1 tyrosine-type recombinase/integrase [Streptomyces clavuligerus]
MAEVRSLHSGTCDLGHPASPTSTVVAIRVRDEAVEYLALGDSTVVLAERDRGCTAVTDRRLDDAGRELRRSMDELPTGSAEHAAALAQYRAALTNLRNRPGGFWIAGSDPEAARHALTGAVPLASLASVTLLSDGASRLVDRFALATWADLVSLLNSSGPDALIRRVQETESQDPAGKRWPRVARNADLRVIRLHDARHGTATLLTAAGVPPRVVMEILGHSQIAVTMNVYAHVVQETQREAVSHMDRLLRRRPARE